MLKQNANSSQSETGVQLFSRLIANKKSSNSNVSSTNKMEVKLSQIESKLMLNRNLNIDPTIFSNGIDNKSVIEISGKSSVGKSELIMHLICRLLLPMKWKLELTKESSTRIIIDLSRYASAKPHEYYEDSIQKVLLLETECNKFNLMRLFCIIENRLITLFNEQTNNNSDKLISPHVKDQMKKFITNQVLKNLIIYKCYSIEQFLLAISACQFFIEYQMSNRSEIVPIFIDSINSNFEVFDRFSNKLGLTAPNHTENYTITLLKRLLDRYSICIIASCSLWTQQTFNTTSDNLNLKKYSLEINTSYEKWRSIVDKQLQLYSSNNDNQKLGYSIKLCQRKEEICFEKDYSIKNIGFSI